MLSFAHKHFGAVPQPGALDDADRELLAHVEAGFQTIGDLYAGAHFRAALAEAIALAREASVYLDRKAPWVHTECKQDKAAAATTVYVTQSVRVVDNLKTLLAPVLPHTAQKLHEYLGYDGQLFGTQQVVEYQETTRSHLALTYDHAGAIGTWAPSELPATVGRAGAAAAGAAVQEAGREHGGRGVREDGGVAEIPLTNEPVHMPRLVFVLMVHNQINSSRRSTGER